MRNRNSRKGDLVGIGKVAAVFGVTVCQARRYEAARIVVRAGRDGNKLLFRLSDVLWARGRWEQLRLANTIVEAGRIIDSKRRKAGRPKEE